jgi:hypothetical protein
MTSSVRIGLVSLLLVVALVPVAIAQPVATFRWQLQPYCNILTLHVTQQDDVFILEGFDDQCGGTNRRTGVVGSAFLNPTDGSIGIGLTTVLTPGSAPVHVDARIHVVSFSGPWSDSAGNSGGFVFTPAAGIGGERRPGETNGIRLGSVTSEQLASELLDSLPPSDRFTFLDDGSFITTTLETPPTTPTFAGFVWFASTGSFRAGLFDFESGGGGNGFASWAGGQNANASGAFSFAFGEGPVALGDNSIALGKGNGACGDGSVALGVDAHTSDIPTADDPCGGARYANAFVFSDGSAPTSATADRQFVATATGGFHFYTSASGPAGNKCVLTAGAWTCSSDRRLKESFTPLDGEDVLRKLARMPVDTWSFIGEPGSRHAGPTAQDFHAAFGLGTDDTMIGYTDINGINMRAIQALEARTRELAEKSAEIDVLKARLDELARAIVELRKQ